MLLIFIEKVFEEKCLYQYMLKSHTENLKNFMSLQSRDVPGCIGPSEWVAINGLPSRN